MFKKLLGSSQLNIFNSPKSIFSGNSIKMYEDRHAWHNQFRQQVTMRIDENIFRPLYCQDNGTPNSSIRILVAMMVLKEAEGLSDQKIFENCRFQELGELIYKILPLFSASISTHYQTLWRVFNEQYRVDEKKVVVAREKEEISAKSVQSPHDTDCHYRNKDGQKVKGYSINVSESCDNDKPLNLIGHVDVRKVSTSDVDFLQDGIEKAKQVFPDKIEAAHADGAYHNPDNQQYCNGNGIDLFLHAIQGRKGRYQFNFHENGELSIFHTITSEIIDSKKVTCKNGTIKWRIKTEKGYRYFTQKDVDGYMLRKQMAETPLETLQMRNNVEATIFQLGYHYPNAKSRYRGEIKHQMWANIRCLWVNFVRIQKYIKQLCQRTLFFAKYVIKSLLSELYFAIKSFLTAILPNNLSSSENSRFSIS